MSALPSYFRHPPARRLSGRRQPRSRDNGPCSRSSYDQVVTAPLGGCRSGDRSRQLSSDAGSGCRRFSGPIQRLRFSLLVGAHIDGSRCRADHCDGRRTGNHLVSFRTASGRHRLPLVSALSARTSPDVRFFRWRTVARSRAKPCGATSSTLNSRDRSLSACCRSQG
jgi:hypothetical protein